MSAATMEEKATEDLFPTRLVEPTGLQDSGQARFERALDAFWWGVRVAVNVMVAALPTVIVATVLRPDPEVLWIYALVALPLGPALSAALYSVRVHYSEPDAGVGRAFWRGYRLNWGDALRIAVPAALAVGVAAVALTYGIGAPLPALVRGVLVGGIVLVIVGSLHALALATFFRFSWAALIQVGAFFLVSAWRTSLALLVLVAVVLVALSFLTPVACLALAGPLVWAWYRIAAPMLRDAAVRFAP